jgi:hypothetical protein
VFDVKFTVSGGTAPIWGRLDLSTTGAGGPWTKVADLTGLSSGANTRKWTVSATPTNDAFIRVELTDTSPFPQTTGDDSDAAFTIHVPRVLDRVEIAPASAALGIGGTAVFSAKGFDTDGKEMPGLAFDWNVSGTFLSIAPAGASATVTAVSAGSGSVLVSATSGGVTKSASAAVTVSQAKPVLARVVIDPPSVSGDVGRKFALKATADDADGKDLANVDFSWTVSGGVGKLDRTDGDTVELTLTAAGNGKVEVTATLDGKEAAASANVNARQPLVIPWDLILVAVAAVVALALVAALLARRRRKKHEQERARNQWHGGWGGGMPPPG